MSVVSLEKCVFEICSSNFLPVLSATSLELGSSSIERKRKAFYVRTHTLTTGDDRTLISSLPRCSKLAYSP